MVGEDIYKSIIGRIQKMSRNMREVMFNLAESSLAAWVKRIQSTQVYTF